MNAKQLFSQVEAFIYKWKTLEVISKYYEIENPFVRELKQEEAYRRVSVGIILTTSELFGNQAGTLELSKSEIKQRDIIFAVLKLFRSFVDDVVYNEIYVLRTDKFGLTELETELALFYADLARTHMIYVPDTTHEQDKELLQDYLTENQMGRMDYEIIRHRMSVRGY
jgi:hypothetical protein